MHLTSLLALVWLWIGTRVAEKLEQSETHSVGEEAYDNASATLGTEAKCAGGDKLKHGAVRAGALTTPTGVTASTPRRHFFYKGHLDKLLPCNLSNRKAENTVLALLIGQSD